MIEHIFWLRRHITPHIRCPVSNSGSTHSTCVPFKPARVQQCRARRGARAAHRRNHVGRRKSKRSAPRSPRELSCSVCSRQRSRSTSTMHWQRRQTRSAHLCRSCATPWRPWCASSLLCVLVDVPLQLKFRNNFLCVFDCLFV